MSGQYKSVLFIYQVELLPLSPSRESHSYLYL